MPRAMTLGRKLFCALLICWIGSASVALQGQSSGIRLQDYSVEAYDVRQLQADADAEIPFPIVAGPELFWVEVERNNLHAVGFEATAVHSDGQRWVLPPRAMTYKGSVVGDPESVVRLSFNRHGMLAYIRSADREYYIEPDDDLDMSLDAPRLHKAVEATSIEFEGICAAWGIENSLHNFQSDRAKVEPEFQAERAEQLQELEIAVEADYEFFELHGDETTSKIVELMNIVEGIYESELRIKIKISSINYYEEDVDPYTATDAMTLLNEMQIHWNSNKTDVERDVVHLFTGKELDNSTVGIAFVAEVCDQRGAYGLSQDLGSSLLMPLLIAHELGHNLGSFHDEEGGAARYIMNPVLSNSTLHAFSESSRLDIDDYISRVGCLEQIEPTGSDKDGGMNDISGGGDLDVVAGGNPDPSGELGGGGGPIDPALLLLLLVALLTCRKK